MAGAFQIDVRRVALRNDLKLSPRHRITSFG